MMRVTVEADQKRREAYRSGASNVVNKVRTNT